MSIESKKTFDIEGRGRGSLKHSVASYLRRLADNLAGPIDESFSQKKEKNDVNQDDKNIKAKDVRQSYFDSLGKYTEHILSNDLAIGMLNEGKESLLASNLNKFTELEDKISLILVDNGYCNEVLDNDSSFGNSFSNDLSLKIIDKGKIELLASNLNKFKNLNNEILLTLADNGYCNEIMDNDNSFSNSFSNDLAQKMIEKGKIELLASNLNKFSNLNNEILLTLVNSGYYSEVMDNYDSFYEMFSNELARNMINVGKKDLLVSNLEKFDLDDDVVGLLLDSGCYKEFMDSIEEDETIRMNVENIKKLIENGNFDRVIKKVDLDDVDDFDDDTLELLIKKGHGERVIAHYNTRNLNMASLLIQNGLGKYLVGECSLKKDEYIEMIKLLIDNNFGKNIIDERCHIDDPNVLQLLFEKGCVEDIASLLGELLDEYEDESDIEREIYDLYNEYDIDY